MHGKAPHLIDLEEALKQPMTTIEATGLTGLVDRADDPSMALEIKDAGSYFLLSWEVAVGHPAASALHSANPPAQVLLGDNQYALVCGVVDVSETLATDPCNGEVQRWANGLRSVLARFVTV